VPYALPISFFLNWSLEYFVRCRYQVPSHYAFYSSPLLPCPHRPKYPRQNPTFEYPQRERPNLKPT
jgi:hypothetical protein